jgi:hypothetical protein
MSQQQYQQPHGRQPISQQQQIGGAPQPIQQQTVTIPSGQQAIVINGTTVYIPANAHTIILPPGYTGPQQTQQLQIVVHSHQQQQSQQHPSMMNGPMSSSNSSVHHHPQQILQQQHQSHQIVIQQQNTPTPAFQHHPQIQQQHLVNGVSNVHGNSTQFISAASATTSHNSVPGAIPQQQLFSPQTPLPAHQSIQQPNIAHSIQQSTPSSHLAQPQLTTVKWLNALVHLKYPFHRIPIIRPNLDTCLQQMFRQKLAMVVVHRC